MQDDADEVEKMLANLKLTFYADKIIPVCPTRQQLESHFAWNNNKWIKENKKSKSNPNQL